MDGLFDISNFMPRGQCGQWSPTFLAIYVVSHMAIALAYFAIPVVLFGSLIKNGKFRARKWLIIIFGCFIFFCGGGHLLEGIIAFRWPAYNFFAIWHGITALVSAAAVITLPSLMASYMREGEHGHR